MQMTTNIPICRPTYAHTYTDAYMYMYAYYTRPYIYITIIYMCTRKPTYT